MVWALQSGVATHLVRVDGPAAPATLDFSGISQVDIVG
jgi:hypothetical protein